MLNILRDVVNFVLTFLQPVIDFVMGVPILRAVLGVALVFFLPGFAWTLLFFSGRQINIIERVALSVGLSIALVTLSILALNLVLGVRVNGLNSALIILMITALPIAVYYLRQFIEKRKGREIPPPR